MKKVAIILNTIVFCFFIFIVLNEGSGFDYLWEFVMFLIVITSPLLNNYLLISYKEHTSKNNKGYIATYIERKKLEEEKKIADLKKDIP